MYDNVLIPTDGSDASADAVERGVSTAERFDAKVHFLHVVDEGAEMSASGVVAGELSDSLEKVARDALDDAESRAEDAAVPSERTILEGTPYEAIAGYADDRDVDLVVVGATGQSGLKEHLLGSTTQRVARAVDASVLIARS